MSGAGSQFESRPLGFQFSQSLTPIPTMSFDNLVFVGFNAYVLALDRETGDECWTCFLDGHSDRAAT